MGCMHVRALFLVTLLLGGHARAADPDPWLGPDKALHFGVSAAITGAAYGVTAAFTDDVRWRLGVATGVGLAAGIGKELLDLAGLGDPSWKDLTWDVFGVATGLVLSWLIDAFVVTPLLAH